MTQVLMSSGTTDYAVLQTHFNVGECVFSYAGLAAWKRLLDHIRHQSTPATFRRHLKTFLFAEVFNTT